VSTVAWLVIGCLGVAELGLVISVLALRARLERAERRLRALDQRIGTEIALDVAGARADARAATDLARRAAGLPQPSPRLALEPVTGRLVRAVALGAGARRAIGRFTGRDVERRAS
jgi:hypothetical protein